jgi:hypothetical protein
MTFLQVNIGQQTLMGTGAGNVENTFPDIGTLITVILKNGFTLAGIILVGLILFGGVSYISSAGSGDQKKMAQAQETLTSALIGFLVIFASYFIIQIVQVITGLTIL